MDPRARNTLGGSTSPYLRQHADNPVHWQQWGPEAIEWARERDVPILLSIGYSACHWCHVMAHESFEDDAVASLMNEHFVCIKVDREERPDLDAVYMNATVAMTGQGGWPMTCFLTPDGAPFYCGTYYPPAPRGGMPSFTQLLGAIADTWRTGAATSTMPRSRWPRNCAAEPAAYLLRMSRWMPRFSTRLLLPS